MLCLRLPSEMCGIYMKKGGFRTFLTEMTENVRRKLMLFYKLLAVSH